MYESWFRLSKRPFNAPPQTADYYADQGIETAREALLRCIERHAGPGIVIGDHGTGKSLLSLLVLRQCRSLRKVAHVSAPGIGSRKELLQTILFEFGQPYNLQDEGQLRLSLIDFLTSSNPAGAVAVLIVDDAHELTPDLLEQLASLSDLVRDGQWSVNLVLFGQHSLEDQLARPSLASLNQRIAARYYLRNWSRATTRDYIRFQLQQAGANVNDVFHADALEAVHDATGGCPRLINQLCDHAMILASIGEQQQITPEIIREAWSDLQSLPTDMPAGPFTNPIAGADPVVEFGTLDDSQDADTQPTKHRGDAWAAIEVDGSDQIAAVPTGCEISEVKAGETRLHDPQPAAAEDCLTSATDLTADESAAQAIHKEDPRATNPSSPQPVASATRADIEVGHFEYDRQDFLSGDPDREAAAELAGEEDYAIDEEIERRLSAGAVSLQPDSESHDEHFDGEDGLVEEPGIAPWHAATPAVDETAFDAGPDAMLDAIEQRLFHAEQLASSADCTSPPPGDCSPESLVNPFLETFDQEEVVINRSASLDVALVARQPSVVTDEGGSLMELLRLLENRCEDTDEYQYDSDDGFEDRVVASPEIADAVASALALRERSEEPCTAESATIEAPQSDLRFPVVETPIYGPAVAAPIRSTELYGSLDVAPGLSTGDRTTELADEAAGERCSDVVIAGSDGALFADFSQPQLPAGDLTNIVSGCSAASHDETQECDVPPGQEQVVNETHPSSPPQPSRAGQQKQRRFGNLFSGLRDR